MAMRKGRAGAKKIRGRRPSNVSRGASSRASRSVSRRGVNPRRVAKRAIKRQQTRKKSQTLVPRSRPTVRPFASPRRVIPKATRSSQKRSARPVARPRRSVVPSARAIKRNVRTGNFIGTVGTLMALNSANAHPEIASQINTLQYSLNDLQESASFSDTQADVVNLDATLNHALSLLESARDQGFMYQNDLETLAYAAMSRWQQIRGNIDQQINQQSQIAQGLLPGVNSGIQRLNGAIRNVSSANQFMGGLEGEINHAISSIQSAERLIEDSYRDIESTASKLNSRLTKIHWMLKQKSEASFEFSDGEDLYAAVKARWDQEGKDDPEGILYLTNQRLLFERKEKVATKKVLFITTAKEMVQELMLQSKLADLKNLKAASKGLFGNQDFLEVEYKEQKVNYHLDGQDSEKWSRDIEKAKSGKIESEKATGTGLSFSELTGDITQADILEIQNEINEIQDEMMLKETKSELAELENQLSQLSRELSDVRSRGYVVEKTLEVDIEVLNAQWEKIKDRANQTLNFQNKLLSENMKEIELGMASLAGMSQNLAAARSPFIRLKSSIASAEAQAEAAEETVLDQYDEFAEEVELLDSHLEWIDWMLDALSTASFKLMATESGVSAVEAIWDRPGLEGESGILYLTDQRLLWEDREDSFEVKIDVPIASLGGVAISVNEEENVDTLSIELGANAPVRNGIFELSQPVAEEWKQMIGRVKSGSYTTDRTVEIDPEDIKRIQNAPEQCVNCGAAFTAPILRGQSEIACEFCGVVARI
jgi:hypothetical protein